MGKINEYGSITTPAAGDLLFIGDASSSNQINNITVANLHKVAQVEAVGTAGLKLLDDGGNYGIFIENGGDVGIGAAAGSPNTALELNSGPRTSTFDAGNNLTWTNMLLLNPTDTVNAAVGINFLVDNAFATTAGAGIAGVKSHATNPQMDLVFITDPTGGDPGSSIPVERMRLLHNGNVGVGTSTPRDLLEVSGSPSSTGPIFTRINFNTGSGAASSYGGIKFTEDVTTKAYITYMGSNFTNAARRNTLEFRASATASAGGITFFADNAGDADVFLRGDGKVGIGPNAWSVTALPEAALHIKGAGVDDTSDAPLLEIEATTNTAVIYFKNSGGAAAGYIINSYNSMFIGSSSIAAQNTHLQISKTTGRLIVGGPISDYTYPLTVGTITSDGATGTGVKPTLARFIGYNKTSTGTINGKSFLVLTSAVTNPQLGIAYQAEAPDGKVEWLSGTFYAAGPTSYFGWRYLGGAGVTNPDNASFYSSPVESNTVYMGTDGGISSANTTAAFGSVNGNGSTSPILTGAYNAAVTVSGATATVTFTKDLSNATYTVIANGWDVTNSKVMFGEVTTPAIGSCVLTFRTSAGTTPNLETTNVKWTFAIYGAKLKA